MKLIENKGIITAGIFLVSAFVSSCASKPESIKAAYVSHLTYGDYECETLREEYLKVDDQLKIVSEYQLTERNKDTAITAIGITLFWPALFFLASGDDFSPEIAQLKGTENALWRIMKDKQCDTEGLGHKEHQEKNKTDEKISSNNQEVLIPE